MEVLGASVIGVSFKNETVSWMVFSDSPGLPTMENAPVDRMWLNFVDNSNAFRICAKEFFLLMDRSICSEPDSTPQQMCRQPDSTMVAIISSETGTTLQEQAQSISIPLPLIPRQISSTRGIPRLNVSSWKKIFSISNWETSIFISSTTRLGECMRTFCPQ